MHTLALELGMTVSELKNRMSYAEFLDWVEYFNAQKANTEAPTVKPKDLAALLGA